MNHLLLFYYLLIVSACLESRNETFLQHAVIFAGTHQQSKVENDRKKTSSTTRRAKKIYDNWPQKMVSQSIEFHTWNLVWNHLNMTTFKPALLRNKLELFCRLFFLFVSKTQNDRLKLCWIARFRNDSQDKLLSS